jgi:hypothetical protein
MYKALFWSYSVFVVQDFDTYEKAYAYLKKGQEQRDLSALGIWESKVYYHLSILYPVETAKPVLELLGLEMPGRVCTLELV